MSVDPTPWKPDTTDRDTLYEIDEAQAEVELFRKYPGVDGFAFFIMRV